MKILTNVQTSYLAGIGQAFLSLLKGLEKDYSRQIKIIGVKITSDPNVSEKGIYDNNKINNFKLLSINGEKLPGFGEVIKKAEGINDLKNNYEELIENYRKLITKESPDLVLINGTYYVPWCLYIAAKDTKIPIILHYHGILSKEVSHWEEKPRLIMNEMERNFDNDRLFYLFPSELARNAVEQEVFGHQIYKSAVIPNPIPDHFFKVKLVGDKKNIGFVGRWSKIKNPDFIKKMVNFSYKKGDKYKFNLVTSKKEFKKEIKKHLKNVNFFEPMKSRLLAKFYEKMGVVISPSYFETYGNVAQEAIASGTPALVSSNMGVTETYKKLGLEDWILDFSSVAGVYKKIEEVSGSEVSEKIRQNLKEIVSENVISSRMIKVFKSL